MSAFEAVVGLEVHLHLKTNSKMFSPASADYFGDAPNSHVHPIDLGLPGVLPSINAKAVDFGILLALALGCKVPSWTQFHRKNYFYPDLPKNYQISQYDLPIGEHGTLEVEGTAIGIKRVHLEEDAGKSMHPEGAEYSLIDLNRVGSPLIEMVTEPDLRTPEQARVFLAHIRSIAQTLGISEANPEEGKMRADVNVSVRRPGGPLGTKVEVKNLNSFRSVARALEYEIKRQSELLRQGKAVQQATLGWDEAGGKTYTMRLKEGEADYRYFPEPDLPPLSVGPDWTLRLQLAMPELPAQKYARYVAAGLKAKDAEVIAYDAGLAPFFDQATQAHSGNPQKIADLLNADVAGYLNERQQSIVQTGLSPQNLAHLVGLFERGEITSRVVKELLPEVMNGANPEQLVTERGLKVVVDQNAIRTLVEKVITANPQVVANIKEGKLQAANALLGQVMKETKGTAKPELVRQLIGEVLGVELG
jgi:aspartyl-tRNA(Asn)/glutamyl-tRNA(Gln) amidotransferase subunit B